MNDYGTIRRHLWALPLELAMLVGAVVMVIERDWLHLLTSVFTFTVSFAPLLFERLFKVRLPALFQVTYVAFIFLSMFCGEVLRFYGKIWPWDAAMHGASGLLVGLGLALWIRGLILKKRIKLPLGLQFTFIVCSSIVVAVAWEIVEFASDQIFGTSSQDHSLFDTMTDLVCGTAGALLFGFLYLLYAKEKRIAGIHWAVEHFERLNRSKR